MTQSYTIGVGTVGAGLHFSHDRGHRWHHLFDPMNVGGNVIGPGESLRSMATFADQPGHLLAGSGGGKGLYLSTDSGRSWATVKAPIDEPAIWSIAIDPSDGDRIFVGASPGLYRSTDRGASWQRLDPGIAEMCPIGIPHVTTIVIDPDIPGRVWTGVEVDGIYRSDDYGETWRHFDQPGPSLFHGDIHTMAVRPGQVIATTPFGVATSADDGVSWAWNSMPEFDEAPSPLGAAYCRALLVAPNQSDTVLVGCGDTTPGEIGTIQVSRDGGDTWTAADFDVEPNSVVYAIAGHQALPDVFAAVTLFGQVFVSEDAGATWKKRQREFGEVRSVVLAPNTTE